MAVAPFLYALVPAAGLVFLGPLGFGDVILTFLLFLLLPVTHLDHLGQFPGEQRAGDEERRESQDDGGEETVGVFGGPLHHVLGPRPDVDHPRQRGLMQPEEGNRERKCLITGRV